MIYHIEFIRKARELLEIMTNVYVNDPNCDGLLFNEFRFTDIITELCGMTEQIEIELRDLYTQSDEKKFSRHLNKFNHDLSQIIEKVCAFNILGFDPEKDLKIDFYTPLSKADQAKYFHCVLGRVDAHIKNEYPAADPETLLPPMDINKPIEKLVLLHQIGMYQFIVDKYRWNNQPSKTAALLASIIGIEPNTKEYETFASNVRGLNSQPEKVLMPKHLSKIKLELMKIGVEIK